MKFRSLVRTGDDRVYLALAEDGELWALKVPLREDDLIDVYDPKTVEAQLVEVEVVRRKKVPAVLDDCDRCQRGQIAAGYEYGGYRYCDCPAGMALRRPGGRPQMER
jgi:hypothetical protein